MGVSGFRKRRGQRGVGAGMPVLHEFDVTDLTPGIWANRAASEIPINAATFIENVRFEDTGIRPEFGLLAVGDPVDTGARDRILGMADHKWLDDTKAFHRVIRVVRDAGSPRVDVWDGAIWAIGTPLLTGDIGEKVSIVSTQGYLLFCDGDKFWIWEPQPATIQDYTANFIGSPLTGEGSMWMAPLPPSYTNDYEVHYNVSYTFVLRNIKPTDGPWRATWDVNLRVRTAEGVLLPPHTSVNYGIDIGDAAHEETYTLDVDIDHIMNAPDAAGGRIEIHVENLIVTGQFVTFRFRVTGRIPGVEWQGWSDPAGNLYLIEDHPAWGTFNTVAGEAPPRPTFLFPFGDRVIALQDLTAPEGNVPHSGSFPSAVVVRTSADGAPLAWGSDSNSSITYLLDSPNDPFDDVMAMGFVANNVGALIRKRTIMRVAETAIVQLPIAYQHWIEGIGTESPHSVVQARDGICFLGHNLMVYYFDGTGPPQPVGVPVHRYLIESVTANLESVHAAYDWIFEEYILGVPEDGSEYITRFWIFDVGAFLDEQAVRWRTRSVDNVSCISAVSAL